MKEPEYHPTRAELAAIWSILAIINMTVAGLIFYSVRIAPKSHDETNVCDFKQGRR